MIEELVVVDWQQIESAPYDGTIILVWGRHDDTRDEDWNVLRDDPKSAYPVRSWGVGRRWLLVGTEADAILSATHWQPLPAPPA